MSWSWGAGTTGAISGAEGGSAFGPYGTAIGGGIGLLTGGLFSGSTSAPPPSPLSGFSDQAYNYYKDNVLPLQKTAIQKLLGPTATSDAVQQAQQDVSTQFSKLPGAFSRQMSGRGIVTTPAQKAAFAKQAKLNEAIATAGASNAAARSVAEQQQALIGA